MVSRSESGGNPETVCLVVGWRLSLPPLHVASLRRKQIVGVAEPRPPPTLRCRNSVNASHFLAALQVRFGNPPHGSPDHPTTYCQRITCLGASSVISGINAARSIVYSSQLGVLALRPAHGAGVCYGRHSYRDVDSPDTSAHPPQRSLMLFRQNNLF